VAGDAVDLVGERESVLLEPDAVARPGREPLRLFRIGLHAINRTSEAHSLPNGAGAVRIPEERR
jgi:hypothetical protein